MSLHSLGFSLTPCLPSSLFSPLTILFLQTVSCQLTQNLPALLKPQPRKKPLTSGVSPIRGLWSAVKDSETITEKLCDKGGNKMFLSNSSQESVSAPVVARIGYSPRMTQNWICRRKRTDRWTFDYFGYFISVISGFGTFHAKSSNVEKILCSSISSLPKN